MEIKILKTLTRIAFLLLMGLIITHALRGYAWLPLTLLLIPAFAMLTFSEGLDDK